jgi:hypothetical protein
MTARLRELCAGVARKARLGFHQHTKRSGTRRKGRIYSGCAPPSSAVVSDPPHPPSFSSRYAATCQRRATCWSCTLGRPATYAWKATRAQRACLTASPADMSSVLRQSMPLEPVAPDLTSSHQLPPISHSVQMSDMSDGVRHGRYPANSHRPQPRVRRRAPSIISAIGGIRKREVPGQAISRVNHADSSSGRYHE